MDFDIESRLKEIKDYYDNISTEVRVKRIRRLDLQKIKIFSSIKCLTAFKKRQFNIDLQTVTDSFNHIKSFLHRNKKEPSSSSSFIHKLSNFIKQKKKEKSKYRTNKCVDFDLLKRIILDQEKNILTLKEIKKIYDDKACGSCFSISTLRRIMRNNLNTRYSYRSRVINQTRKPEELLLMKYCFIIRMSFMLKNDFFFISIDQSNFKNYSLSKKQWTIKNEQKFSNVTKKCQSLSVIGAVSSKKLIAMEISEYNSDSNSFISFIEQLKTEIYKDSNLSKLYENFKICILLDNSKLHCCKKSLKFLAKTKFFISFLPPYMPTWNFIEYYWGLIKAKFRKQILNSK